jgi:hypothetical protein
VERLEREVNELLLREVPDPGAFDRFAVEVLTGCPEVQDIEVPYLLERHLRGATPLSLLRGMSRWGDLLFRLEGAARRIGVPSPPPQVFFRGVEAETFLPLRRRLERVRLTKIRLDCPCSAPADLSVVYEVGGEKHASPISPRELPFLLPVLSEVVELLESAAGMFRQYASQLEGLRERLARG